MFDLLVLEDAVDGVLQSCAQGCHGDAFDAQGASTLERARPLRVERVAMAALRAALEDTIDGVLEHEEIEHIGDAMMIQ